MKMRAIWKIRAALRNLEYDLLNWVSRRPDWVQKTSYRCYYPPDQDSYLPYQGWSIDSHTKFFRVPVSDDDFPHLL